MKDLTLTKNDGTVVGRLRVDMLSNSPANFTIMEMFDGIGNHVDSLSAVGGFFKRRSHSWAFFTSFCTTNNLQIKAKDANGANAATLLGWQSPAGTHYPIVSATGSSKTFLIATDVSGSFAASDVIKVYNSDNSLFGTFTEASDSYSSPNTSVVVNEVLTDIPTSSGKYIVNLGH